MKGLRHKVRISTVHQQVAAIVATRDYLLRLMDTKETPRIPREVRREARALLRHFPPADQLRPALERGLSELNP